MHRSRFSPTLGKLIAPLALVALSFVPGMIVQQAFFGTLSYPLSFIYHGPPFVYRDKPWYITPIGAVVTALVWAAVLYAAIGFLSRRRPGREGD